LQRRLTSVDAGTVVAFQRVFGGVTGIDWARARLPADEARPEWRQWSVVAEPFRGSPSGIRVQRLCFGLVQRLAILVIAGELFVGLPAMGAHKRHPVGKAAWRRFPFHPAIDAVEADPHSAGDGR